MQIHSLLILFSMLAGCSAPTTDLMSDQVFAEQALARAKIGQSLAEAETSLKELGLACFPVVVRAIPGVATNSDPQFVELSCSDPLLQQRGCRQQISLLANNGKISSITLNFEQLPTSRSRSSACGR